MAAERYRTTNDRVTVRVPASLEEWRRRADDLREHVLATAGLLPPPEKTPLGHITTHTYDKAGEPTITTDATGSGGIDPDGMLASDLSRRLEL